MFTLNNKYELLFIKFLNFFFNEISYIKTYLVKFDKIHWSIYLEQILYEAVYSAVKFST